MGKIGLTEILLIVFAIVLLFGATKLPKLAKSIGESIKELRNATKGESEKEDEAEKMVKVK
jgi:sec-independent protein translocase protein TatA